MGEKRHDVKSLWKLWCHVKWDVVAYAGRTQVTEGILVATQASARGTWMSQKVLQKMATLSKFILKIADTNHRVHRYLYTLKICCKFGLKTTLFFCPARTTTLRLSLLGLREAAHSVSSSYRSSGVLPGLTSFCTASKAPISRRGRCESPAPASVFPCLLPRLLLWNVKIQDARHRASPKVTACKLKISSRDKRQPFCVYASSDSGQFLM